MTRRTRIRLLVVLVVLGLPLLLCAGVVWFVAAGGLERRIEREWRDRFPGRLDVGRVEIVSASAATIHDLVLTGEGGGEALATVARVEVVGGLLPARIERLALRGVRVRFDQDGLPFLREVLLRLPRAQGEPRPLALELDGALAVGGVLAADDVTVQADIRGAVIAGTVRGTLAGAPLDIGIAPAADGALTVDVRAARVSPADLVRTVAALGLMAEQEELLPWLPGPVDLAGTALRYDIAARVLTGHSDPRWADGEGATDLRLDGEGLRLTAMRARDAGLGTGEGGLGVDFSTRGLTVELDRWTPGPRVPVPAAVPLAPLLGLLPAARLTLSPIGPRIVFTALPRAGAQEPDAPRVEVRWRRNAPLAVEAVRLPTALAQGFLPPAVRITAGRVDRLGLEFERRLQRITGTVSGLGLAVERWTATGIDGGFDLTALDPHDPAAGWSTRVDLPSGSVVHRGRLADGELSLTISRLDELASHVRGPVPVPPLRGFVKLVCGVRRGDDGAWTGRIRQFGLAGLGAEGIVREGALAVDDGGFVWRDRGAEVRLAGQLVSGEVKLPGERWLDLAARTPIFTGTAVFTPERIALRDGLARAADARARPEPEGFTAGFAADLDHALDGTMSGVVDRADLAWFRSQDLFVPLPGDAKVAGESAVTWSAGVDQGALTAVDGYILPLNVDLTLLDGKLDISGIKGALRFRIVP